MSARAPTLHRTWGAGIQPLSTSPVYSRVPCPGAHLSVSLVAFRPCCLYAGPPDSSFFSIPAVANVVDENISLCRRLIVLVAPGVGFLKTMSEEQIAVYNALIQDGMKVILIELEKIGDYSTMPESIQYVRQRHGVVQWDGDLSESSQRVSTKFWKNVRYRMPPRRYPPPSSVELLRHMPCRCAAGSRDAASGLTAR